MVNHSTNNMKANNHHSPKINEHQKDHGIVTGTNILLGQTG